MGGCEGLIGYVCVCVCMACENVLEKGGGEVGGRWCGGMTPALRRFSGAYRDETEP